MYLRFLFPLCFVFLFVSTASAQLERTLYNIFEVDSVKNIEVDIFQGVKLTVVKIEILNGNFGR